MKQATVNGKEIYVLESRDKEVGILGYAVWYTFSKFRVHKDEVKKWFAKHGLQEFEPEDPKHADAFRRICTEHKEKKIKTLGDEEVYLLIRPVDKNGLVRKLVLEVRKDGKKKSKGRISYDVVGEIEYDANADAVTYNVSDPDVRKIVDKIVEQYEQEKDCYTEEHFRKILLRILDEAGKVKLKPSGSIYFVSRDDFHYIEKFSKIIDELKALDPDNRTEIWYAPIIDTEQFRKMVTMRVEDTLEEILNSAIERLIELKNNKDLSESEKRERLRKISYSIEDAAKTAEKYKKMLETSLVRSEKLLEKARELLEKVKSILENK